VTGSPPGYGRTPLPFDELDALLPDARDTLPVAPTKADVHDLEQLFELDVRTELTRAVLDESLTLADLLDDSYVRTLHRWLYGPVWTWAGRFRRLEVSIGVAPEQVVTQLRTGMDGIRYRWEQVRDWDARRLGLAVHAEVARVHPFTDGNGRSSRLLADLVHLAAQPVDAPVDVLDWRLDDKRAYIRALRRYDSHRDPSELARLVATRRLGG
jgi:fido (protein-threonine AMPylation protein)